MRDYGKVFSRIWESADFRALSEDGRTLVLYLLTCPHGTIAGTFRVPDGYACEDLQWSSERVSEGFSELSHKGFATRCEDTKWVWVTKFLEWNPPENPNQTKAAVKVVNGVPDQCGWKRAFMRACGPLLGLKPPPKDEPLRNPSPTLPQPVTVAVAVAETVDPPKPPEGGRASAVGLKAWLETVKAKGEKPIPEGDPVFTYADDVGIPHEFLQLAWLEFRHRYTQPDAKRYRDWRAHFRNAVRRNYTRVWYVDPSGEYRLTTVGLQAQRAHAERAA